MDGGTRLTADEIEGQPYVHLVHPGDANASADTFERVRSGEPITRFKNRYRSGDGGWRWLSWVAVPEAGKLYSITRDVTDEKVRESELENALAERKVFADVIVSEREQRLIAGAVQSAERAKTLVQRLPAFARRQPLQSVPVDVAKLVTEMGDLIASTTGPQIKVLAEALEELPLANAI